MRTCCRQDFDQSATLCANQWALALLPDCKRGLHSCQTANETLAHSAPKKMRDGSCCWTSFFLFLCIFVTTLFRCDVDLKSEEMTGQIFFPLLSQTLWKKKRPVCFPDGIWSHRFFRKPGHEKKKESFLCICQESRTFFFPTGHHFTSPNSADRGQTRSDLITIEARAEYSKCAQTPDRKTHNTNVAVQSLKRTPPGWPRVIVYRHWHDCRKTVFINAKQRNERRPKNRTGTSIGKAPVIFAFSKRTKKYEKGQCIVAKCVCRPRRPKDLYTNPVWRVPVATVTRGMKERERERER